MLDYTNYDYQALVDRMTEILKDKDGWGDAYQSSTGQTLIQLMADVTDHLHYMLERRTLESFLDTAKLRSSIIARASELGYRPLRIRGHSGELTLSLINDDDDPTPAIGGVSLEFLKPVVYGDRVFYVISPATIHAGESEVTFLIREGTIKTKTFDLDAGEEPLFPYYDNIDESLLFVYNNGDEYFDVRRLENVNKRSLSFLAPGETFYDVKYGVEGMRLEFGDNVFGKTPTGVITVEYAELNDIGEPLISIGGDFSFTAPLVDSDIPDVEYRYTLKNSSTIFGGEHPEHPESVVKNATAYHRSNGRAVTNEDYSFWMKQAGIGGIVDAAAYGEEEFDSVVYNSNNVYLTYVKEDGTGINSEEKQRLYEYFNQIKTTQAHMVFNQARNVYLRLFADVVKTKNVPISNSQAYSIIRNFIIDYLKIRDGSIGGTFELSDMVNAMYDIKFERSGITYDVVDYVKLGTDAVIPFDFPGKTSECFVEIDPTYEPVDGHEFILNVDNLVCRTIIQEGESFKEILQKMRDIVREVTPFAAVVELSGMALDAFGRPLPLEIDNRIGYHLLIGRDTPYISPTDVIAPMTIGSAVVDVQVASEGFTALHTYYSAPAGRRPMIPLRVGTAVTFTAPTDTKVNMYTRTVATDESTEEFFRQLIEGEEYTFNSEFEHALIFEFENNSVEDVVAEIVYQSYLGVKFGLRISALDNFGSFLVRTTGGDLEDYVSVDYRIKLPTSDYYSPGTPVIERNTLRITDLNGNVIFMDNGNGKFVSVSGGVVESGNVNYTTGVVALPKTMPGVSPIGKYYLMYDQNKFENISVSSAEVIKLLEPPVAMNSPIQSLSYLKVS